MWGILRHDPRILSANLKIYRLNPDTKINWRLLIHAAKNKLNEEEETALNAWIDTAPELHQKILDDIVQLYRQKDRKKKLPDKIFNRFLSRYPVTFEAEYIQGGAGKRIPLPVRFTPLRAAAAIAILLVCGGLFFFLNKTQIARSATAASESLAWKEIRSATGKQVVLTLSDGSRVRLAPGSRLRYPALFGTAERRVQLEGEAFFEITKNPEKPFLVQAPQLTTRVLGTSFQVVAYPNEKHTAVTVVTGKVAVSRNRTGGQTVLLASLSPEQRLELDIQHDSSKVTALSPAQTTAIRDGKLVFDNSSLAEVAERLQVQYGITVHLADAQVGARRITATFDQNISMQDLSDILAQVARVKIRHDSNNLYIGQ